MMPTRHYFVPLMLAAARAVTLPDGLEFRRSIDVRTDLQPLLRSSYITTPDDALALDYAARDLSWMLDAPEADVSLRVGLGEVGKSGLVAFVCAVPSSLQLLGEQCDAAVEVSLLCVDRAWRGRGLTRMLLAELRRRAEAAGVRHAIFTQPRPRPAEVRPQLLPPRPRRLSPAASRAAPAPRHATRPPDSHPRPGHTHAPPLWSYVK